MQNSTDARVDGVSGLLLHHFKPQSFEEFRAATEFKQRRQNEMRQRLRQRRGKGEKVHKAQAVPDARWMNNTWSWIHEHTNGATHASMLLRVPELCRAHTRFAASLRDCGLQARPPMHPPPLQPAPHLPDCPRSVTGLSPSYVRTYASIVERSRKGMAVCDRKRVRR